MRLSSKHRDRNYRVVAISRSIKPWNDDNALRLPGDIANRKTAEHARAPAADANAVCAVAV